MSSEKGAKRGVGVAIGEGEGRLNDDEWDFAAGP